MTAFSLGGSAPLNSAEELEAALRHIGATRYHNLHPFHRLLHGGKLNKGQVQAWALNRYYYQSTIPIKDAVVISRFRDRGIRLEWRHRIEDHDGDLGTEGGIERWLKLTEGPRARQRLCGIHRRHPARDALCGGRLCAFRPRQDPARGHRLLADGTVRAEPARRTHLGNAGALRFRQPRHHELFQPAHAAGAARRQLRARLRQDPCQRRRRSARRSAMRCFSRPMCYGFSSMRCIMPMSTAICRRARLCPRTKLKPNQRRSDGSAAATSVSARRAGRFCRGMPS